MTLSEKNMKLNRKQLEQIALIGTIVEIFVTGSELLMDPGALKIHY